jgi:RNA polymerase sigma factor (sigma-70 family)
MSREEEARLFDEYANSTDEARKKEIFDKIILANLKFAFKMASEKAKVCNKSIDDLFSEAKIGLIEAFNKYDPHVGTKFISFVVWYVRRALNTFVSDDDLIRIPIALKSNVSKKRRLNQTDYTEREGHANEVMSNLKQSIKSSKDENPDSVYNEAPDLNSDGIEELEHDNMKDALWKMLETSLDSKELYIMRYSFGLKDDVVLPAADIAANLNMKKAEFQKIKKAAYEKIAKNKEFYSLLKETVNS